MTPRNPLRVLAIGAHPDDIECGCAGTLARCATRGDSVTIAVAARGDSASSHLCAEELVGVRGEEARAAAALIGAEFVELDLCDSGIAITADNRALFTDLLRRCDPDVVITHCDRDYGSDHSNTLALTLDASVNATVAHFRTDHPAIGRIPWVHMMEPLGGYAFQPEVYVDITETFATNRAMLECHRSQIEWMNRYGGMDFREYIEVVARFRGYQCGVRYAEGFVAHKSFAHVPPGQVLP